MLYAKSHLVATHFLLREDLRRTICGIIKNKNNQNFQDIIKYERKK
jgi:hypothetical protein